nr:hypothetical protein [Tanacetum cinerariifolium]
MTLTTNLEEKQLEEEQAVKAQSWKFHVCYDDDIDKEGYNSLNDNIISELPPYSAVTPTEPVDSLIMGDEHLNTISATESDEVIKSCIENLVPNLSEPEGENGCDVPAGFTTFSNDLFNDDYDSDSILISLKIDSLFDEFIGELTLLKSFPPGIDETDCHPEKEIRFAKRLFDPLMEEIDLFFNPDDPMPPGIEEDDDDSKGDIPILEELLDNYSLSLPNNESYHFD